MSQMPDIYERLARALGMCVCVCVCVCVVCSVIIWSVVLCVMFYALYCTVIFVLPIFIMWGVGCNDRSQSH